MLHRTLSLGILVLVTFIIIDSFAQSIEEDTKPKFLDWILHLKPDAYEDNDQADYVDEVLNGHKVKKDMKHQIQEDCMCVEHFIDPHCGSDKIDYDNGCFFLCAQKKNPSLRLKRWGKCSDAENEDAEKI